MIRLRCRRPSPTRDGLLLARLVLGKMQPPAQLRKSPQGCQSPCHPQHLLHLDLLAPEATIGPRRHPSPCVADRAAKRTPPAEMAADIPASSDTVVFTVAMAMLDVIAFTAAS